MYFLRQLKKFNLPNAMIVHFYTSIVESILTSSITIWYSTATGKDKSKIQSVIRSAVNVSGCNLPPLQDLYTSRTLKRAVKIISDPSHPGHNLIEAVPSGKRLQSIKSKTSHHKNSIFPSATGLIDNIQDTAWSVIHHLGH
ncbi:uncharacterized protein LOC117538897, partial [Tachysurus ichikawai]